MSLHQNVKPINIVTLLFGTFVQLMILQLAITYIPYLLVDKYSVRQDKVEKTAVNLEFYSALFALVIAVFTGILMDTFGRKWVSVGGFLCTGIALIFMPLFDLKVFPYFYIMRIF